MTARRDPGGARDVGVDVEFLDLEDGVVLVRRLGAGPVRDVGLIEIYAPG